jgi:hypothetical protein
LLDRQGWPGWNGRCRKVPEEITVKPSAGRRSWLLVVGSLILSLPASLQADADKDDPRVYAVGEKVEGKTYAEWSVAWWKWGVGIRKDRNPILDKTGEFAGQGQQGPVWFLAGNVGGKTIRKCAVPAGKPVFFPVINFFEDEAPAKADEKKLRAAAKAEMDRAEGLEASLDGQPITGLDRFRVASAVFTVTAPDKAADAPFGEDGTVGTRTAVSDGYWVMLKPLSEGKHTLHFKGRRKVKDKETFALDVTYELTVEKK